MNLKRAIGGFLLSLSFLSLFVYVILSMQLISENYLQKQNNQVLLGSISDNLINVDGSNGGGDAILLVDASEVNAKSAISVESNLEGISKIIFEKDSNLILPIASLTKLMTAVVVLDNYNLTDTLVVDKIADSQDPMKQDVKLGDVLPVESFLDIMLVGSSNKAAYTLSELIGEQNFVGLMNQKAKDLGLQNTFFVDPTGLSPEDVSTASDLAKLAEHILKNYSKIANISKVKEFYVPEFGKVINRDQLLDEVPEIVCSKTGFTTAANGCLLLVVNNPKNNNYLINVVLGADDRFLEMKKIINWSNTKNK